MTDPLARTLRLLALLQRRSFWRGDELADSLGVSKRMLRRDVARLRRLGYPIESDRGVGGGYVLGGGGTRLPPLVLDDDEATALVVALRAATRLGVTRIEHLTLSVLTKLDALLPARLRAPIDAVLESVTWSGESPSAPRFDLATLLTLSHARRDEVTVVLDYTRADGARARRHVEPHHIVAFERRWYLVAWDLDRDDWRTFRLDRIEAPRPTPRRIESRTLPAPSPTALVMSSRRGAPVGHALTAEVIGSPEGVAGRVGWLRSEQTVVASDRVQVTLRDEHPGNLATALAALMSDVSLEVTAVECDEPTRAQVERLVSRLSRALGTSVADP